VIRALGNTIKVKPGQSLSKHDFLLPLSDVLLDLVDQDLYGPSAANASQLGCSLADDFLNLATLAGQLLWLVDTAPVRTGTPDSLSISMLAEGYLMQLRTACDILAVITHTFCIDEKKKGQVPKESFNDLVEWVEKNPSRVPDRIRFILEHRHWFDQLRGIRDKLVHNRFDINIFTDDVAPSYALMSSGDIHLHFLRKPRTPLDDPLRPAPLLPLLKLLTQGALALADQIAGAIARDRQLTPSKTHVLNGVYVPALHHMLSYAEPSRKTTDHEKQKRKIKARHLLAAGDYLNTVNMGHPDGFWLPFAVHMEELFGVPPNHIGEPRHPKYRDGEALIDWHFNFERQGQLYVVLLRDGIHYSQDGLEQSRKDFEAFRQRIRDANVVVVSDVTGAPREIPAEEIFDGLILDTDPIRAAERAFVALVGSEPPTRRALSD